MKPTTDDLRRSAEFAGYTTFDEDKAEGGIYVARIGSSDSVPPFVWNPPENAEQDRELLHKMLEAGYEVSYRAGQHQLIWNEISDVLVKFESDCHQFDFLTFAASKLSEIGGESE